MKKILLFFSVAVFVFCLAASVQATAGGDQPAQAGINYVVITGGELNYRTTQPITWAYGGTVVAPKFNISIFTGTETPKPIASQVLCKAAPGTNVCAFSWTVGKLTSGLFVLNTEYKIRVCVAGANPAVCGDSMNAFRIIPSALKNQQEVLNLFKTAMSNRYGSLDSQGVKSYILGNGAVGSIKISTTTANTDKVYNLSVLLQLNWFKTKFLPNTGGVLTATNEQAIQQAMVNRYTDFCVADWKTAINGLKNTYTTNVYNGVRAKGTLEKAGYVAAVPSLQQVLNTTVKNCNGDYNKNITCVKTVACVDKKKVSIKYSDGTTVVPPTEGLTKKSSNYNNATIRYVEQEGYMNERDGCTAAAYVKFNQDKVTALTALTTGKAAADGTYSSCIGNSRISSWGWVAND